MQKTTSNRRRNKSPSATSDLSSINNSVNDIEISSANTSRMRKPLSDLTTFNNLIPTDSLRKVISSNSVSNSETQSLLSKSRASNFPIYPEPSSSGHRKPYNNPRSDTRSGSSVGSSSFNNDPKTKPQNTSPAGHQLPPCSSTNLGDESSKLAIYSRRLGQRKTDVLPKSTTPVEEGKNDEKAISVALSSTPVEKATAAPFDSVAAQIAKDKGKATVLPFDSTPALNLRGKDKETSAIFRSSNVEKARDKGKAVAVPVSCTSGEMEHKGRSTPVLINSQTKKKQKEKRQADNIINSCPPLLRTSNTGNELNQSGEVMLSRSLTGLHRKQKKRKCTVKQSTSEGSLPPEYVQQMKAYFEEVDAFELPVEEVSDHDLD